MKNSTASADNTKPEQILKDTLDAVEWVNPPSTKECPQLELKRLLDKIISDLMGENIKTFNI